MLDDIVALDLETTGLDPARDRIIEIGMIRLRGSQIADQYQSLCNPGTPIPTSITDLTGITDQDVETAPQFEELLPGIRQFIGNSPILGHSIGFDLEFLSSHGFTLHNPAIDSYALISTLLPTAPRFSLSSIALRLGISVDGAHRALNDVITTAEVYFKLWEIVHSVPDTVLKEIVRLGRNVQWGGELFFEEALRRRTLGATSPSTDESEVTDEFSRMFPPSNVHYPELHPTQGKITQIDVDAIAGLLVPGGPVARSLERFEHRSEQVTMLKAVAGALNTGRHTLIEAPTGVGKSMGYLIPAAHFASSNECRIVISTNTINLQEQLVTKDIPFLAHVLDFPLRATILKGRANYLCPRKLLRMRQQGPASPTEMQIMARILVWIAASPGGDRGEITLRGNIEQAIWSRLSAEDDGCTLSRCISQMGGGCSFYRARKAAESAHLIVVNHALLLSDVITEGRVLPDYRYVIVDEAHHLEEAVTQGLSFRTDAQMMHRLLRQLGSSSSGLMGDIVSHSRGVIPHGYFQTLESFVGSVSDASRYMAQHIDGFFLSVAAFLRNAVRQQANDYAQQVRILPTHRRHHGWKDIETHWENLGQFTGTIADAMAELVTGLQDLHEYDIADYEDLVAGVGSAARHLQQLHMRLDEMVSSPDPNIVYWVELQPDGDRLSIHSAPLDVGPMISRHLWDSMEAAILTSATLRTDGSFAFIREQLDAEDVDELVIGTPFDYEASTLLYLVDDIPEPENRSAYQRSVESGILQLCQASEGRALVLFTSYAQLQQTSRAITDPLIRDGITVYDQSAGSSRSQLIEGFVQSEKAVLMGTRSFWEGVDIPGVDLSVLVIVRLPFAVPSDPLFAARSEQFENSFIEYAVPEAILRFRQGFGRLIRRKDDRGVVAIFDRRVISKRYGRMFLDALPHCTIQRGRLADLPEATRQWLAQSR